MKPCSLITSSQQEQNISPCSRCE